MNDGIAVLLLSLFGFSLIVGAAVVSFAWVRNRKARLLCPRAADCVSEESCPFTPQHPVCPHRPVSWLAIRSRNPASVQFALGLNNPKPCSWAEGLAGEQPWFIAPPVHGWVLVVGSNIPEPVEDIDVCFRFLLDLSRKVGQVQFFSANRILNHHAWAWLEAGRVVRAYAWAGKTLWNQGVKTRAELDLGLKCFHYFETAEPGLFRQPDLLGLNTEKVSHLAQRWSVDPGALDERTLEAAHGIAGEASRLY